MYTTKVMSDVMKSGPTYVGTKCPYCTYNLFGQVFTYGSYVREGAEGEVDRIYCIYILYVQAVRLDCIPRLGAGCICALRIRVARKFLENSVGIYCIYNIYVQVVRKRVYVARPVRRGSAENVCGIYCIYIICTSCTYKCTPRIPFCVMRCAHT